MKAEFKFKDAVHDLCVLFERTGDKKQYPSPANINRHLGRRGTRNTGGETINGREAAWRREVFIQRGWTRRDGKPIEGPASWDAGPGAFGYAPPGTFTGLTVAPIPDTITTMDVHTTVTTGQPRTGTTASTKEATMAEVLESVAPKRGVLKIGLTSENLAEIEGGGEVRIPNGRYEIVLVNGDIADDAPISGAGLMFGVGAGPGVLVPDFN